MEENVCTDVQITKYITNSREPIVVETKTTTTTTTVTKRICISKDANVDLAELQSLLDGDNPTTKTVSCIVPPNSDVTTKTTFNKNECAADISNSTKSTVNQNPNHNQSLLSSTKIEIPPESNENDCFEIANTSPQATFLSPNLSKISTGTQFEQKNKNVTTKSKTSIAETPKTAKQMDAPVEKVERLTRSKVAAGKSTMTKSPEKENYINDLINEYISLKKKPLRKKAAPKVEKQPTPPSPMYEQKDLSAIFENSDEGDASPLCAKPGNVSPIDFDGASNDDYPIELVDFQAVENQELSNASPVTKSPLRESSNSNQTKHKLPLGKASTAKKSKSTVKKKTKSTVPKATLAKIEVKKLKTSKSIEKPTKSNNVAIKIYSPSGRGKFQSNADNKLILTKKMIEKKLQNLPDSSKTILQRFGKSNNITIDADSRLILYSNENDDEESDHEVADDDVDMLDVLTRQKKSLLVREISEV